MDIRDKLIADKKHLSNDIDCAIEKLNEYIQIIDKLAKQVEIGKEALEYYIEQYNSVDYPVSDDFAIEALKKIEKTGE